jgi:hypothetical protein
MSLTYMGTTVTFTPKADTSFLPMVGRKRISHKALDGTNYTYETSGKGRTEISLNGILKADRDTLYGWWSSAYSMEYKPDVDVEESYMVKMTNSTNPFRMMPDTLWDSYYEGSMILEEV